MCYWLSHYSLYYLLKSVESTNIIDREIEIGPKGISVFNFGLRVNSYLNPKSKPN